ncbi:MAG: Nif3-like dinuclear metal center hexameric protein [Acidimicrobiia bacterium]|nr:Nif3-like dinuclear metal center hexameric protein [Acidimicrobiia bacterium]
MTTVGAFLGRLGTALPLEKAAGWDPSVLQLGDPSARVDRVGVCHEVTEDVVAAVEADPVDLLVTYHPLLFRPVNQVIAGRSPAGRAHRLIRAAVALATVHTAFDAAPGGTADALAAALGVLETTGFGPLVPAGRCKVVAFVPPEAVDAVASSMSDAGAGVIGNYSACSYRSEGLGTFVPGRGARPTAGAVGEANAEAEIRLEMVCAATAVDSVVAALVATHPYEEPAFDVYDVRSNLGFVGRVGALTKPVLLADFASVCARELGSGGMRVSGEGEVRRVAVVAGSGGQFIAPAVAAGADVLVTGDVGHHSVVEALDRGLAVIDPGHAPTERPGMASLVAAIAATGVETLDHTGIDPTPWR